MFCKKCGKEILESDKYCPYCGEKQFEEINLVINSEECDFDKDSSFILVAKIFLIIGMVAQGIFILPLGWVLPIGLKTYNMLSEAKKKEELITWGILSLLFINLIAGIFILCIPEKK